MTAWRNRIVGHGEEAPDQLLANPKNWRMKDALRAAKGAEVDDNENTNSAALEAVCNAYLI